MATKPQAKPAAQSASGGVSPIPDVPKAAPASFVGKSGAQALLDILVEQGVEVVFGYPGGAILPTFDALYGAPIRFVLTRCEQGAGHMADGYSRATGKVGTTIVTSGPGATNLTTALGTAYMDSIPMVAITGQVATAAIGNDAFQEADVVGVTRPVTKHNILVKNVNDLPRIVREAYHIARTGRPGPVLVDLPKDVQVRLIENGNGEMNLPGYRPRSKGNPRQVRMAAEAINAAQRPVLYVGGGVILSGASEELRQLARKAHIPVTTTLLGLGAIDEIADADLALHMLGMHGSAYANYAVQASDCLIAVGARFDDRVTGKLETFAPHAKIIHIDVDPSSISKNVDVDVPVVGDAKAVLAELLPLVEYRERAEWFAQIGVWKQRYPFGYRERPGEILPQQVIDQIGKITESKAIVATGVGQHQMWTAQFYRWRQPRQMITSGGLGTMGYGFPAALGAAIGCPDKLVIDIDGDGSFQMTCNELATAGEYQIPVKVVILNNHFQGMVRQWQELFYQRRYMAVRMANPSFAKVAEAFGCTGLEVRDPKDLPDAIRKMIATPGPVVLDAHVSAEENVYPMVAVGKSLHEMEMGGMA
ncbi:MAG TPA: biosynthetic-type acetolactate synthase large subunit [Phycisphaerae bacterium]|jgi:acetolactate synthase-1/2/3 large subunit|nr:biosynthetic-type acetolactate synthase large subunit [Phycisphaerae bacterium]HOB74940.1 biosynthetic-type acetolactate synthase large subunit [Phycisphaerae bacterium]HOJ56096.1 biosynthetic-type acetolactate synthase large subunit [Phycisphaerae bacterium]HOL25783.1 biosynthetic-type acetolactate synthase large subunit [Phycisphaerae bacterium]HPP19524.1 biosynthetic-type acetolactate synthase large subunit [Phycisphaerae bacterium]